MSKITLDQIAAGVARGPYAASWDALEAYTFPRWYEDGKFGIFIHWGPYAVPAFGNEWYPRNMYVQGSKEYQHHRGDLWPARSVRLQRFPAHVQGRTV
ncbi:MAG: alpha-L-fucosidase [Caldilineaceae bacterium]